MGCRRDMFQQPSSKPLEQSDFFQDNHMASRPSCRTPVARGQLNEDEAFYTGKIGTNLVDDFPMPSHGRCWSVAGSDYESIARLATAAPGTATE